MPYPNEHAARIIEPNEFIDNSFRRKVIEKGISIIIGKLKSGNGNAVTQAYRFNIDYFTANEAKSWLNDHDIKYISFEPASEEKSNNNFNDNTNNAFENRFISGENINYRIVTNESDNQKYVAGTGIVYDVEIEIVPGLFESIAPGAFTRSLDKFLTIKSFINHDPSKILSTTKSNPPLELLDNDIELFFKAPIPPTTYGQDLIINLERDNIKGASFSFKVNDFGETYKKTKDGNIHRRISNAEIYEIGPVTNPAYQQTEVSLRSKEQYEEIKQKIIDDNNNSEKELFRINEFLSNWKEL